MPDGVLGWGLRVLWVVWAVLLIGGLTLGRPDAARRNRLPRPVRMMLSATLLLAALLWLRVDSQTGLLHYGAWIVLGMALGLLGDLFMAGLLVRKPHNLPFGILTFGLGHLAYVYAFWTLGRTLNLGSGPVWLWSWLLTLAAGLLLWTLLLRQLARGAVLNVGTLVYALLISLMSGAAFAMALQTGMLWPLAAGAVLFMVSDFVLGRELMRGPDFPFVGDVIWVTYTAAQMLIVYSSAWALRLV